MSALSPSPSPAFTSPSPRAAPAPPFQSAFRARPSSFAPSPRSSAVRKHSPRLPTTPSPAAPPAYAPAEPSTLSPKQPRAQFADSGPTRDARPRYADAGTQYSPEGLPPTAGRGVGVERQQRHLPQEQGRHHLSQHSEQNQPQPQHQHQEQPQQHNHDHHPQPLPGSNRKRKEGASSPSPHMSPAGHAATAAVPPAEPELRVNPDDPQGQPHASSREQQLPERPAQQPPEPQEARSTHGHSSTPKRPRAEPSAAKIMPRAYETCNPKDLGVLIANMLMELIRLNDQIPLRDGRLTRFHSRAPPGISVADYLQRLIQHATLSPPILLSMVYYIDRLCALYSAFTINSLTVHRFLITAATVAAKGLSDSFWTNPTYARIGGIPVSELATLEMEFLQKVQWKIVPKPETLEDYYNSLVDRTDGFQLQPKSTVTSAGSSVTGDGSEKDDDDEDDQEMRDPT